MKKCFMKVVMCVVAVLFALTLATVPSLKVSADADTEINLNGTVAIDFESDSVWWVKYVATEGKMVEMTSSGSGRVQASLYKDAKDGTFVGSDIYCSAYDGINFSLTKYLKAGTYYLKVEPNQYIGSGSAKSDTKVTFKDVTDDTFVASIDETNFPDTKFRNYVSQNLDLSKDKILTKDEVKLVTILYISNYSFTSLEGIGFFSELERLTCDTNSLSALDLSKNANLEQLNCYGNPDLTSLNVSGCKKLWNLYCYSCNLSSLDLSGLPALYDFSCNDNPIRELDLRANQSLATLSCDICDISNLKISGCKNLTYLSCYGNKLTSLDLSSFSNLARVICRDNQIETLKISEGVKELDFRDNKVKKIDISKCSNLQKLLCTGNEITDLDISGCPFLDYISRGETKNHYEVKVGDKECELWFDEGVTITRGADSPEEVVQINEDNFPSEFFRNVVSEYDLDNDTWLDKLEISMITDIFLGPGHGLCDSIKGIEYFTELQSFTAMNHKLETLDLSNNPKLKALTCTRCNVKNLIVSNNKELTTLNCYRNSITKLDLKNNTKLTELQCQHNNLSSLDLSSNKDLNLLYCYGNNIKNLDLLKNPNLADAYKNGEKSVEEDDVKFEKYAYQGKTYPELAIDPAIRVVAEPTPTPKPTAKPTAKPTVTPPAKPTSTPTTKPATVSLSLDKKTANVVCGKNISLKATLKGSSSKITWKSSDSKIATVDSNGKVTSKMAGEVTITATAAGKSASCVVTVLYKDVTNAKDFWYAPTNYLTAKGVVKGYDKQTKFKPANDCTRAQMVTFLYRLQGEPKVKSTTCKFKDVKKTDYFYKPVIWASEKGITTGVSKDKFAPQRVCTRAQTVTFLWRMAGKPVPKTTKNKFPDVKKSDYFYTATLWASEKKILAGLPDGTFNPQGKCLRRQMVTFLYKYDKYINVKK